VLKIQGLSNNCIRLARSLFPTLVPSKRLLPMRMAISVGTALVQKSNFISPSATTIQLRDGRREGARKAQSTFAFDLLATDSSNVTIMRGHPANWRAAPKQRSIRQKRKNCSRSPGQACAALHSGRSRGRSQGPPRGNSWDRYSGVLSDDRVSISESQCDSTERRAVLGIFGFAPCEALAALTTISCAGH
jgi:hypothetical protein